MFLQNIGKQKRNVKNKVYSEIPVLFQDYITNNLSLLGYVFKGH